MRCGFWTPKARLSGQRSATRIGLAYPQELQLQNRVQRAVIDAMQMREWTKKRSNRESRNLLAAEKRLNDDLKAGRIPDSFEETFQANQPRPGLVK